MRTTQWLGGDNGGNVLEGRYTWNIQVLKLNCDKLKMNAIILKQQLTTQSYSYHTNKGDDVKSKTKQLNLKLIVRKRENTINT